MLNFSTAHGNHQQLLYSSPEHKEKEFTDSGKLQTAPSPVPSQKMLWSGKSCSPRRKQFLKKNHQERTMLFAWLFETFHVSEGEKFQSRLLQGILLLVFLVSIQYLLDNTWIIKCGDISHVA